MRTIALVHQRLVARPICARIDLAAYFRQLVQELFRSYFVGTGKVTPRINVYETAMNIDRLIPCALIVNELVCNAFKYAFPQGQSGEVRFEVHRQNGDICLSVADDGVGFSPDADACRDRGAANCAIAGRTAFRHNSMGKRPGHFRENCFPHHELTGWRSMSTAKFLWSSG